MQTNRLFWLQGCCALFFLLEGCGSGTTTSTPIPTYPACTPSIRETALPQYGTPPSFQISAAETIYRFAQVQTISIPVTGNSNQPSQNNLIPRREALKLLRDRVRKWSRFVDVPVNDNYFVRITVTYISPDIAEGVVLNQILFTGGSAADFQTEVLKEKEGINNRSEHIFLITLTANQYKDKQLPNDKVAIQLPVRQMTLASSNDLPIVFGHTDHHLEELINLRTGPEHGYIAYPIAVLKDGICEPVIDPVYSTTLTLNIPDLIINDSSYGPQTWNIDYQSLMNISALERQPDLQQPDTTDGSQYEPSPDPPAPDNEVSKSTDSYWEQMARFIWYHLTDSVHQ